MARRGDGFGVLADPDRTFPSTWERDAMSTPPVTRRPLGITIVVLLTAAVAVLDIVVGVLLLFGVDDLGAVAGMTADETATSARVVGGVFLFFGLVQAVVAYQLARASNGARLVLTVILLAQQLHSLYLGAQLDIQRVSGFAGLAVAVVILVLVWNPTVVALVRPAPRPRARRRHRHRGPRAAAVRHAGHRLHPAPHRARR